MRGVLTFIWITLFALAGVKATFGDAAAEMTVATQCVSQSDCDGESLARPGTIAPIDHLWGAWDIEMGDSHELAVRVSTSAQRLCRFSSLEISQFIKALARKLSVQMSSMVSCQAHLFDSSPSPHWDKASDHYVFAMRHILI